jgi:hypothetical protein
MPATGSQSANKAPFISAATPGEVNDATALNPLGTLYTAKDTLNFDPGQHARTYRYVQLHSGATAAKGALVIYQDFFSNVVTTVATNAANRNQVAGALQSTACTPGNFTWILVAGPGVGLAENGTATVVGVQVISGATTTGRFDTSATVATAPITGPWGVWISLKNAVVNGSTALGTDVAAAYFDIRPRFDF